MKLPRVNPERCIGCGICVTFCPAEALKGWVTIKVDEEKCTGCLECLDSCPVDALEV